MVSDNEGFKYPEIDEDRCTNCGICRKICPFHDNYDRSGNLPEPIVYAVKNKNEDTRLTSSSGGIFSALSDYVLENDGLIYGVGFDDNFMVCHQRAENKDQRDRFKGSKYVQSELGDIFLDIKSQLQQDKLILFTGTPCQTAGLKAVLKNKKYENLIVCDLVCAGAPSPLLWDNYVSFLRKKIKTGIKKYNFRYKGISWHNSSCAVEFNNGKYIHNKPIVNIYSNIFNSHNALRPACHSCKFSNFHRPSDLTIGDFWGIEKAKPHFDDDRGVSLVLINTPVGNRVFNEIEGEIIVEASNTMECRQRNLTQPSPLPSSREAFWQDYHKYGFEYIARKYTAYGLVNRFKREFLKPLLKKAGILK